MDYIKKSASYEYGHSKDSGRIEVGDKPNKDAKERALQKEQQAFVYDSMNLYSPGLAN